MTAGVIAVVVTFNRKLMLLDAIRGILAQSVIVERIIIVDNASTDGTKETLESNGLLDNPQVSYCRLNTNTGGAGGFATGVKMAAAISSFEWAWLMDDDVEAEITCLENLLKYREWSGCIHPRKIYPDGLEAGWGHSFDPFSLIYSPNTHTEFENGKKFISVNVGCFEGMLVSRQTIDKIGFPDERYFIIGDDTLYGYKASTVTNVGYVAEAFMNKKIGPSHVLAPWKAFFLIRNSFLLRADCIAWSALTDSLGRKVGFYCLMGLRTLRLIKFGVKPFFSGVKGAYVGHKMSTTHKVL